MNVELEPTMRFGTFIGSMLAIETCNSLLTVRNHCILFSRGTGHYMCHHYFNYQFHYEGLPPGARILVIRNEHLRDDWNSAEHFIGGQKEILPRDAGLSKQNVNKDPKAERDKSLSRESQRIVCAQLCNEIVNYKKILRAALNLSPSDIRESIEELRQLGDEGEINIGDEIERLRKKSAQLTKQVFTSLDAWQTAQMGLNRRFFA